MQRIRYPSFFKQALLYCRAIRLNLAILATQLFVLYVQPLRLTGDDSIRFDAVSKLSNLQWPSMKFSVVHPFVFGLLGKVFDLFGAGYWVLVNNDILLWSVWSMVIITLFIRHRDSRYIANAQILVFCSMLTPYLLGFSTEAFTTLAISASFAAVMLSDNKYVRMAGWAGVLLTVVNIPVMLVGLSLVCISLSVGRKSLRYLIYPFMALGLIVLEASYSSGGLALSKYSSAMEGASSALLPWGNVTSFHHPIFFGCISIILSFGRGLLLFIPGLVTGFKRFPGLVGDWIRLLFIMVLALIPVYSMWWAWYGGMSFGPRFFMLGAIVGGFGFAEIISKKYDSKSTVASRVMPVFGILLSSWVAIIGVAYYITPKVATMCMQNNFLYEPLCWYNPAYSTLFAPLWEGGAVTWQSKLFISFVVLSTAFVLYEWLWGLCRSASRKIVISLGRMTGSSWGW